MKLLISLIPLVSLFVKDSYTAPTLPSPDTVSRLVEAASDDLTSLAVAKAAAVGFAGGVAINTISNAVPNVTTIYKTVVEGSNAALRTAAEGSNTAIQNTYEAGENTYNYLRDTAVKHVDAVQQVDPIQVINETESAVLLKNKAVLKAVFDAKRNAVQALKDLSKLTTNFTVDAVGTTNLNLEALINNTSIQWELMNTGLVNFWNSTLSNLNAALTNAQSNIQASKETIASIYNNMTLANAQTIVNDGIDSISNGIDSGIDTISGGIDTGIDTISGGIDTTITITGNASSTVLNSLVKAKTEIHEAAENFDSKTVISKTKKRIGNAIVKTFEGAGNLLEQAGVYDAIDSIVHGFAGMPFKTNQILEQAEDTVSNASVTLRDMWEGYNSDDTNDLKRSKLSIKTLMNNEGRDESMTLEEELELEEDTGIFEDENQALDEATFLDGVDEEIDTVEGEVAELEDSRNPEEFEAQTPMQAKNKEIMQLMQKVNNDDNEIVR